MKTKSQRRRLHYPQFFISLKNSNGGIPTFNLEVRPCGDRLKAVVIECEPWHVRSLRQEFAKCGAAFVENMRRSAKRIAVDCGSEVES